MWDKIIKNWKFGAAVFITSLAICGAYVYSWEFRKPFLDIYFFNLNRGRSIFIRTPNNKTILIDGGQNSQIIPELTKVFPLYKRRIDTVILTSSVLKNAGGLPEVSKRYEVGNMIEPIMMGTSTALDALGKVVKEKHIPVEYKGKGDRFVIDGVAFNVLFPDPLFKFNKTSAPEMVLEISYASTSALFLGDVSKTIQKSLIPNVGKVNIAEYAHSGAKSRVSTELLDKINPEFIVKKNEPTHFISDGKTVWKQK